MEQILCIGISPLFRFHFETALAIRFHSLDPSFALSLTLLRHLLVDSFHLENVLHLSFLVVLENTKIILRKRKSLERLAVWFNRRISAARPSAIV